MSAFVPFWFIVIAILWTGFFILEGFDFGVGMLHSVVGRDDAERRAAINTIGPLWDGNEVWLIVAGASMFAAFPGWYVTMFSGMYLALVLLLTALIIRGVAFEYRGKRDAAHWRRTWDWALTVGSVLAPRSADRYRAGRPAGRAAHRFGAELHRVVLGPAPALRRLHRGHLRSHLPAARSHVPGPETTGEMYQRSQLQARRIAPLAAAAVTGFVIWTHVTASATFFLNLIELLAILAVLTAACLVYARRDGFAFAATTVTIAACILGIFVDLYPRLMVSSTNNAYSLTVHNTASPPYSLKAMTVVVVLFLPLVLIYQAWAYYVFRRRVSASEFQPPAPPSAATPEPEPRPAAPDNAAGRRTI